MNNYSEMWAEFCFLLSENINSALSEKDFENQVVRALEVLGWREFKNEIERQPTVQLGREGTLRPDLIIYGNDKKTLIVIEVKRPSEDIARDNVIGQLRSYMRQLKSDFGFLIGADLRIYYDGSSNPHPDPILLERIDIERNSRKGINFFELFNKQSFLNGEYQEYLEAKIKKFNQEAEVRKIIERMLLPEAKRTIISHLRNEFADVGDETFLEAIAQIDINISRKDAFDMRSARAERSQQPPKRESVPVSSNRHQSNQNEATYIERYRKMLQNPNSLPSKIKKYVSERGSVTYSDLKRACVEKFGCKSESSGSIGASVKVLETDGYIKIEGYGDYKRISRLRNEKT